MSPHQVAEELDEANIFVWDGNYYALEVTTRLGLEDKGGMVRVGPVHYNTLELIRMFGENSRYNRFTRLALLASANQRMAPFQSRKTAVITISCYPLAA